MVNASVVKEKLSLPEKLGGFQLSVSRGNIAIKKQHGEKIGKLSVLETTTTWAQEMVC